MSPATRPSAPELLELGTLVSRVRDAGVLELLADFDEALAGSALSDTDERRLTVVRAALARELAWLRVHPKLLFQTVYNLAYWYDNPKTALFYRALRAPKPTPGPPLPWEEPGDAPVHQLMTKWRIDRGRPGDEWLESLRPPLVPLLFGQVAVLHLSGQVQDVEFSPDGREVYVERENSTRTTWNFASGSVEVSSERGSFPKNLERLKQSPNGRWTVTGRHDWDRDGDWVVSVEERRQLASSLVLEVGDVQSLGFSADSRWFAIAIGSHVEVYSTSDFGPSRLLGPFGSEVSAFAASDDGKHFAVTESDGTVSLFGVEHQRRLPAWFDRSLERGACPVFTRTRLFTEPRLWDATNGRPVASLPIRSPWGYLEGGPPDNYLGVCDERIVNVDPFDGIQVFACFDGRKTSPDRAREKLERTFFRIGDEIAYAADGAHLAVTRLERRELAGRPVSVMVIETETLRIVADLAVVAPHRLALPSKAAFVVVATSGSILVLSLPSGATIAEFAEHRESVSHLFLSQDAGHVLSIDEARNVFVWEASSGRRVASAVLGAEIPWPFAGRPADQSFLALHAALGRLPGELADEFDAPSFVVCSGELEVASTSSGVTLRWPAGSGAFAVHPSGDIWANGKGLHLARAQGR